MQVPSRPVGPVARASSWIALEHLWPLALLAGIACFVNACPIRPQDFWWHLKAGQVIVMSGRIPSVDTFSFTMGGNLYGNYASYWLMEVAYYLLFSVGGPALIVFVHSLLVTSAYGLLVWLCWRISGSWRIATACTLFAVILGFADWSVRPQVIAFPAGVTILAVIYAYQWRPRRSLLAIAPVTLLLWANSHATFLIGLGLLGLWLLDELVAMVQVRARHGSDRPFALLWPSVVALVSSSLACLANPRGIDVFLYAKGLSGNPVIRSIVPEWAPPTFGDLKGTLFLVGLLVCAALLASSLRRPSRFQLLTFVAFGALALSTRRGIVWFGIVMAPVLANHLGGTTAAARPSGPPRRGTAELPALNWLFAAVFLAAVLASLPWFRHLLPGSQTRARLISDETPTAATEFMLRERLPGRLFHDQGAGSYLIWAAQPAYPVFVDARLDLYPLEIWHDYGVISDAEGGWQAKLHHYGVNTLMLNTTTQAHLVSAVSTSSDWRLVYQDETDKVFVRVATERMR
ncbi:MAG: hypothetical protein H6Q33_4616 [Deltaproteobacteria bacterium]|nr:hypothetical protein [Deltaproteobacteria bacterium]